MGEATLRFWTDFADQAVVLPVALVLASGLALLDWRRAGLAFAVATVATLAAMLLLKLGFAICAGPRLAGFMLSPSGHTAAAGLLAGFCLALRRPDRRGVSIWLLAALLPIGIGGTRLALGLHTWPEVALGGAVGVVGGALALALAGPRPATLRLRALAIAVVATVVLAHGAHLQAEAAIRRIAHLDVWRLSVCLPRS